MQMVLNLFGVMIGPALIAGITHMNYDIGWFHFNEKVRVKQRSPFLNSDACSLARFATLGSDRSGLHHGWSSILPSHRVPYDVC